MNIEGILGNHTFQTKEEIADFIRKNASNICDDIWISDEESYPCLAILVNENLACVHYFLSEQGKIWQSVGRHKGDVFFPQTGSPPWAAPGNCVISLDEAIACVYQFFDTLQRPDCIEWREL